MNLIWNQTALFACLYMMLDDFGNLLDLVSLTSIFSFLPCCNFMRHS